MFLRRKLGIITAVLCIILLTVALYPKAYYRAFKRVMRSEVVSSWVDPYLAKVFPISDRFWLHRANSVEKLRTVGQKYKGVEIDVFYFPEEDMFDASHHEPEALNYPLSENLEVLGKTQQKLWVDYKNLTMENAEPSAQCLERLLAQYGVPKENCIIESPNYVALKTFKEHGFYTSFYVPYLSSEVDEERLIEQVRVAAASGNVNAVSFPDGYYPMVKKAEVDLDLLAWHSNGNKWWEFYVHPFLRRLQADDGIKVILVDEQSRFDRD